MSKSPFLRLFLFMLLAIPAALPIFAQEFEERGNPPAITSFSPVRGAPGTLVTVVGRNLAGVSLVSFGSATAVFQEMPGGTLLRTWVPAGATTAPIRVTTTGGTATSAQTFLVTSGNGGGDGGGGGDTQPPKILHFAPNRGTVGTLVTLTGPGLGNVRNVFFGDIPAPFQEIPGGTEVRATVPIGAVTAPIFIATLYGTASSIVPFTIETGGGGGGGAPTISFISPGFGPIFTRIQIGGSGFTGTTDVRINDVPNSMSFNVVSDSEISAVLQPVATSGKIKVITTSGTATTSLQIFNVVASPQPPSISSFSPGSGSVGTPVTIFGQNLGTVQNVFFGGQVAAFQEVPGGNQLNTWVPPGAATGTIRVVTANGVATSTQTFLVP